MLNSVPSRDDHSTPPPGRVRLRPDERRRQLLGIGLRKFVERPAMDLSLDEVATEAGVSRCLLFHYFPTKALFHEAVVAAAGRRVLRTVRPDPDASGEEAIRQLAERFIAQIVRRHDFYLALVYGQSGPLADLDDPGATATSLRSGIAEHVCRALPATDPRVAHAWVAYVEDRALHIPPDSELKADVGAEAEHCVAALLALTVLRD